jgi:hypothetical protein
MQVTYHDECKWVDTGDGLSYDYVDADGAVLAQVALRDGDAKLWLFQIMLPERYKLEGCEVGGVVFGQFGAKKVAETILLNTIVTK